MGLMDRTDIDFMEDAIRDDINDPKKRIERLEAFMVAVAKEVKCLPSFADPSPDGGNAHIMRAIVRNTTKYKEIK